MPELNNEPYLPKCPACYGRGLIPTNLSCGECDDGGTCVHSGHPCPHGCVDPDCDSILF